MTTNNENHDEIYAIVRDAMDKNISINDAVARLKGLEDGTQLTEESFTMADNVVSSEETKEETRNNGKERSDVVQSELASQASVDPGKDADADINDIVGVDQTDDTVSLGVVPDDQLVSKNSEIKDNVLTATEDGAKAKPASESNEVAPAVGDEAREQNTEEKTLTRSQKKALRREAEAKSNTEE